VPGGPAHLSRCLDKDDKVEAVDGCPVHEGNVVGMLFGSDLPGSKVTLQVSKADSGKMLEVELVRIPKASLETMVKLFKKITLLKQNGHNNETYEINTYPVFQERSLHLIDEMVSLISRIQVERHNHDVDTKRQFELLYSQISSQLALAFDTIDDLRAEIQLLKLEKSQVEHNFTKQMDMERDASPLNAYDHEMQQGNPVKRLTKELEDLRNNSAEVIQRQRNVTEEIVVGASVNTLARIPPASATAHDTACPPRRSVLLFPPEMRLFVARAGDVSAVLPMSLDRKTA